jgi:ligand-binding SRPBCC domain-containing protein
MGIDHSRVIARPASEAFAWHTRACAMTRPVPPWQPMTVVAEADSVADGRAVLGLPGGLRSVAQHAGSESRLHPGARGRAAPPGQADITDALRHQLGR